MLQWINRFFSDERGATAIEYSLIASMIAVACIGAFTQLGGNSSSGWNGTANKVSSAMK
jgi:pilus assembly protein Flp/PilA